MPELVDHRFAAPAAERETPASPAVEVLAAVRRGIMDAQRTLTYLDDRIDWLSGLTPADLTPPPPTTQPPAGRLTLSTAALADWLRHTLNGDRSELLLMAGGTGVLGRASALAAAELAPDGTDQPNLRVLADVKLASRWPPTQVRVAADEPSEEFLIVDRAMVLTVRRVDDGAELSAVEEPVVVRLLCSMFEGAWRQAAPFRIRMAFCPGTKREILRRLAAGAKDETIARDLGISVRTSRRHIAEIMRGLGSASRFQAGAQAALLGLLPPQPEQPEPNQ